ncbi:beta-glucosidase 13 [Prunus yedoensis var. nudiflora]|uniref:Beta-glucosidase 13 n=1 Tax=Prunus yedoensis var. nudiflora TaxID=2094558 RepID=A0A314YTZ2_PRUYE|nr:beta-glucosidase 13 [Prunus yedoensis var. nudiflora]
MAIQLGSLLFGLVLVIGFSLQSSEAATDPPVVCDTINRTNFETGFIFGAASAAYQYEGAVQEDGRGPSIWDNYTHQYPERIKDWSNADVTVDQYHRYKEDVEILNDTRLDAYRFSISWSRVLPNGTLSGGVNEAGIEYYNKLINKTLEKGLKPYVTIFHWDLPQALEEEYGGFLSFRIVEYANLCFERFGDRVKYWITLNEPYAYSVKGYALGTFALGRCSDWQQLNCTGGNSSIEPYLVTHHLLLAHATTVDLYKTTYQVRFMDPITSGHYPHSMQVLVGHRLPKFKEEDSKLLAGSFDFLGLNYYTTYYASYAYHNNSVNASYITDARVNQSPELNGVPIGPQKKYDSPLIYITENGVDELNDPTLSLEQALNDTVRKDYYHDHLCYVQAAIK